MPKSSLYQFDSAPAPRIVFGAGSVDRLGALAAEYGGRRALLVTDPGIVRAGHAERAAARLKEAGIAVSVFDRVVENPTTGVVGQCADQARSERIDLLVGLGGGSSLDTAKGCNFLLTGGGRMEDYWGRGKATRPMLPMVAMPTTAGTGSECQSFALITQETTHVKMACGDPKAMPKAAILDPVLTLTQPRRVTAASGIDAIAHAVESAVTCKRNRLSLMYSREAFRLCSQGLRRVLANPEDLDARGDALLGAALAGAAIENSMLGAAHAAANPLTARYGVVHGLAVGLMLLAVVRFNAADPETEATYRELAEIAGAIDMSDDVSPAAALANYLESYLEAAGLPRSLAQLGVSPSEFAALAEEAARQWTAGFNPRPVEAEDFLHLYQSVAGGDLSQTVTSGTAHDFAD